LNVKVKAGCLSTHDWNETLPHPLLTADLCFLPDRCVPWQPVGAAAPATSPTHESIQARIGFVWLIFHSNSTPPHLGLLVMVTGTPWLVQPQSRLAAGYGLAFTEAALSGNSIAAIRSCLWIPTCASPNHRCHLFTAPSRRRVSPTCVAVSVRRR